MSKIRTGIVGLGIIGSGRLEEYCDFHKENPEDIEVKAICDIDEKKLNELGDKFGIPKENRYTHIGKMLKEADINTVDVCLHNNMHAPVAIAAMEAGKDVYSEKPMAGSYADALDMYETMKRTGKKLHVQMWSLYSNETKAAKRYIDNGDLGHIYHMRSYGFRRRGRPYVDGYGSKEFDNTKTAGGGALFDMGVYHIAQLLYLTGLPELERVTGTTYQELDMNEERRKISDFNVEELGVGFATYKGGLTLDIIEAWAINAGPFMSSMIAGSKGGVTLSPFKYHTIQNDLEVNTDADLGSMEFFDHTVYADTNSFHDSSAKHWVAALLGKVELIESAKIALNTQLVQEGIYLSKKLGREVTADEIKAMSKSIALDIPNL